MTDPINDSLSPPKSLFYYVLVIVLWALFVTPLIAAMWYIAPPIWVVGLLAVYVALIYWAARLFIDTNYGYGVMAKALQRLTVTRIMHKKEWKAFEPFLSLYSTEFVTEFISDPEFRKEALGEIDND